MKLTTNIRIAAFGMLTVGFIGSFAHAAQGDSAVPFTGTGAANGARMQVVIRGAPVTDTPVDGGGPTAQAQLDSLGGGTSYAAFPDPGGLVVSVPGLLAGQLGPKGGPVSPPPYPLYVTSDTQTTPEASSGAGPYKLDAASSGESSKASATSGVQGDAAGNAGLVSSEASVVAKPKDDIVALASAVSDSQGVTVGPVTIGEVRSEAKMSLAEDGSVTPATSLSIGGLRIGGIAVDVTSDGLGAGGGTPTPLPVNAALKQLLSQYRMSIEVVPAEHTQDAAIAPALRISTPVPANGIGTGDGTMTLTLGSAVARMTPSTSETQGSASFTPTASASIQGGATSGTLHMTATQPSPASAAAGSHETAKQSPVATNGVAASAGIPVGRLRFDISSLYLAMTLLGGGMLLTGQLIRILGVRGPWNSNAG